MQEKKMTVRLIGKTCLDHTEIADWLGYDLGADFEYDQERAEGATLAMLAGKRCYKSFDKELNPNLKKTRKSLSGFIRNILKTGHGSVLEHAVYNFAIEDVSRVLTHELVRHRVGTAISQESGRYCRPTEEGFGFYMPRVFKIHASDSQDVKDKKRLSQSIMRSAVEGAELAYRNLEAVWDEDLAGDDFAFKKKLTSSFRRIAPFGMTSGLVWSCNLRSLRFILEKRFEPAAEEEIQQLALEVFKIITEHEPEVFADWQFDREEKFWFPKNRSV